MADIQLHPPYSFLYIRISSSKAIENFIGSIFFCNEERKIKKIDPELYIKRITTDQPLDDTTKDIRTLNIRVIVKHILFWNIDWFRELCHDDNCHYLTREERTEIQFKYIYN